MSRSDPGDLRGNTTDRNRRRLWLLATFGDGQEAPCSHCGRPVDYLTMEVDRFPLCGHQGGRYVRGNIVPSCRSCNRSRCSRCAAEKPAGRPGWWSADGRRGITLAAARRRARRRATA